MVADWKLRSPAVVPFMFSLTWGLDSSEVVGASPREGCGSGLGPLQAPQLCGGGWRHSALWAGSLKGSVGGPLSASAGLGWVNCGENGADRNREGRTARFL